MRLSHASLAVVLTVLVSSVAYSQAPTARPSPNTPDFKVQVWGDIVTRFNMLVGAYVDLRGELEKGLPPLTVTDNPAETRRAERALARRIRAARVTAKEGDIFTPAIGAEFKKVMRLEMSPYTWAVIMDDNPGEFRPRINATYPKRKPLSTVPANILATLPSLPDDIQYRFAGRHLILLDTRARVILDRIPYAIQCSEGEAACRQ